ncbi:MAG: carbohydrate porin [Chthoniobacterales bacterium]|nr:carbohydrate porin [Chthoniobacterales bacterium]
MDFEKAGGLPGLTFTVSGLYAAGPGLTNEVVHDLNVLSNIDTFDSIRLYEAWLQQEFWDGKFSLRLGQILADAEFFVSDYGALFINSSFGAILKIEVPQNRALCRMRSGEVRIQIERVLNRGTGFCD